MMPILEDVFLQRFVCWKTAVMFRIFFFFLGEVGFRDFFKVFGLLSSLFIGFFLFVCLF